MINKQTVTLELLSETIQLIFKPMVKKPQKDEEISPEDLELFQNALDNLDPDAFKKVDDTNPRALSPKKTKKNKKPIQIDLHGFTLDEAKQKIDEIMVNYSGKDQSQTELTIITGKGRHSAHGQGVLVRHVYAYIVDHFSEKIAKIDSSPAESLIEGLPLRGYFNLILK